jgi:cytochrome c oxidase cbb3-type subunit 3
MFLRCLSANSRLLLILLIVSTLAVSASAQSNIETDLPAAQAAPATVAVSQLFPGGGSPPPLPAMAKQIQGNPYYTNEGHRLFIWYNCVGCHANGGGGMGPALMDNQWRYGGRLDQIFASIAQGRPNGMPYWSGKIPNGQIWELAAFVQSLSAPSQPKGVMPKPPPPPAPAPAPPVSEAPNVQLPPR